MKKFLSFFTARDESKLKTMFKTSAKTAIFVDNTGNLYQNRRMEQHPQSVSVAGTVTPTNEPMDSWMQGGWSKFLHQHQPIN